MIEEGSSEAESSLEEIQSEKSFYSSNKTNLESNKSECIPQDAIENSFVNKCIKEDDLKNNKVEFEKTSESASNTTENLKSVKPILNQCVKKEFSNSLLCPNCELLKKKDVNKKNSFIISKDFFMKFLLIIMLFVIFLNYILYLKLANLEQIASRLAIHNKLTSNVALKLE